MTEPSIVKALEGRGALVEDKFCLRFAGSEVNGRSCLFRALKEAGGNRWSILELRARGLWKAGWEREEKLPAFVSYLCIQKVPPSGTADLRLIVG